MIGEQRFVPENIKLKINIRENGDVYIINGLNEDRLLDVAIKVCEKLNRSPLTESSKEYIRDGNEYRPQGCFAVKIYNGELWIDNRNARGCKSITDELKKAVEFATN